MKNQQKKVETKDHAVMTELYPLITMACEMMMLELEKNFDGVSDEIMKRIRNMVERILAKSR